MSKKKSEKYSKVKEIAKKTKDLAEKTTAQPAPPVLVRSPGGSAREAVSLNGLYIPDAWHAMEMLRQKIDEVEERDEDDENGDDIVIDVYAVRRIREQLEHLWHLCHDLHRHAHALHGIVAPLVQDETAKGFAADLVERLVAFRSGSVDNAGQPKL